MSGEKVPNHDLPLQQSDVEPLLSTVRLSSPTAPREDGWLYLATEAGSIRRIAEKSGVTPAQRAYGCTLEVKITPALAELLGGMVYGSKHDEYYLQLLGNGRLFAKYNHILGSRLVAEVSPAQQNSLQERAARGIAERFAVRRAESRAAADAAVEGALKGAGSWKQADALDPELARQLSLLKANATMLRIELPTEHLSRYSEIKKLLSQAGGTYDRRGWFSYREGLDVDEILSRLQGGQSANAKKEAQFFRTPQALAKAVVEAAGPLRGKRAMEPSAGDGAIADELRDAGAAEVLTVENWDVNAIALKKKGYEPLVKDFLTVTPAEVGFFDVIAMNPPFTKRQDLAHVRHALSFLAPEGRLSAIISPAFETQSYKDAVMFRELVEFAEAETIQVPPGAFKESGTEIRTVRVQFDMAVLRQRFQETGRCPTEFGLGPDFKAALEAAIEAEQAVERARERG